MHENQRVAVVAAHPDDETIGLGACLARMRDIVVIEVTDGSPHDLGDAVAYGFSTREDYARARREELTAALALAGIRCSEVCYAGFVDQETSHDLPGLTLRLVHLLAASGAGVVYAPAYEGGHPDHDAVAFAVHAACRRIETATEIWEYPLYHGWSNGPGKPPGFIPQRFLDVPGCAVDTIALTPAEQDRKRRMVECFRTQHDTLRPFALTHEFRRKAPCYDFTQPPASCIYYDAFPWGITSRQWLRNARSALDALGLVGEAAC